MAYDIRQGLIEAANALGMSAQDLATIVSYESGFNPDAWGGAGGNHYGLIQFGPRERQQYGVVVGQPESQLGANGAIVRYMKDRGFKPGMSLLDAYSTVNAGQPGLYNASDTASGGQPGDVYDKVTNQFAAHRTKAAQLLGAGTGTYDPRRDTPSYARPTGAAVDKYATEHPVGPEGDVVTTSPYALPGVGTKDNPLITKEYENPFEKVGAAVGKLGQTEGGDLNIPTIPNPQLTSLPAQGTIDPAAAQRQALMMQIAMQRLNSGQLWPMGGGGVGGGGGQFG